MARKKKVLPLLEGIEILSVAAEGKALAKVDGLNVFVMYGVPGDIVDIQLTRKRNKYAEGRIVNIQKESPFRQKAFCEHFGVCGGCKWQILPYDKQLEYKQQHVLDNLQRIGKIDVGEIVPILGSKKTDFYRNKLEFTFSDKKWLTDEEVKRGIDVADRNGLGFHIPGMFDKVLDIRNCWLQRDPSNAIRNELRSFCQDNQYSFFNLREQEGLMRTLIVRTSSIGELMLIVVFYENDEEKINLLMNHLQIKFPEITSLFYVINPKANDSISDLEPVLFSGKDHILEKMEDLYFKIGPKSFYQTNSEQAYELYRITREFADLKGDEFVYDLYTGTGTIANFIARSASKVIGIEYVPEAIEDAKENSAMNKIDNTLFFAGDMKNILNKDFLSTHGQPDVIITDPPRAGMHEDVVETILLAAPKKIVYVSCNSATQARDLALMNDDYRVVKTQAVDMFPQTHHIENVVLLERRSPVSE